MKIKSIVLTLTLSTLSSQMMAMSPTTSWNSDVVENYLNPNKGATVSVLTDLDNGSRWYATTRLRSELKDTDGEQRVNIQGSLRLRGLTKITDDIGFVGDFWLQANEHWDSRGGANSKINGWDDSVKWEQYRFGFESDKYGALMIGKHSTTWSQFTVDMGSHGLYDAQLDVHDGGKGENKVLYKSHFDNNLFLAAAYDLDSDVVGMDLGFQTADIYSYIPDSYGIYFATHNGQPSLTVGNTIILANAENTGQYRGTSDATQTYQLNAYKQFAFNWRIAANVSYSKFADGESAETIKARLGSSPLLTTEGGVGKSATLVVQKFTSTPLNYILLGSVNEFSSTIVPQISYTMFGSDVGVIDVSLAYVVQTGHDNIAKLGVQWDF